ncbi:MAG: phosphoribosylformylglycinamidine synthase I [Planctomycetes bacterium]|nr:phosphoribosylformylglycinamidine synthase I [Planctomycetota bacterium]
MRPRVVVLRTAGTNCDLETVHALQRAGAEAERVHVRRLAERPADLGRYAILVLPGGFTYGDDVAAGRVLAVELRARLGDALGEFVAHGGLVLGVCNGFQVLVRAGLLPGGPAALGPEPQATLAANESNRFECRWVHVSVRGGGSPWLPERDEVWPLPVAHGEGRFLTRGPAVLEALEREGRVAFRYVDERGRPGGYPANPNGSAHHIAGVTDPTGQVLGLMPHPERNVEPWHHPAWTRLGVRAAGEGLALFRRGVAAARSG